MHPLTLKEFRELPDEHERYPSTAVPTYSGGRMFLLQPRACEIDIRDIAHGLATTVRWNGQGAGFYSVAQHAVRVSLLLPDELKLWGLLHDAAEAYIGDLSRPLKQVLPYFVEIETGLLVKVAERFGLPWPVPAEVFAADDRVLDQEWADVVRGNACRFHWSWEYAEREFLWNFGKLFREQVAAPVQ